MPRVFHLVRKELLELRQDPRIFGIIFIAPVIQLAAARGARVFATAGSQLDSLSLGP